MVRCFSKEMIALQLKHETIEDAIRNGADLSGANLIDAHLSDANLIGDPMAQTS